MKSRFVDKPSPEFTAVVDALRPLGEHMAVVAYAEATHDAVKRDWMASRGLKPSTLGHGCIRRLLGKRCTYERADDDGPPCEPPGADHSSLWYRDGKAAVFLTQPYGPLSGSQLAALVSFADRWGLVLLVDTWPAYHYPGRTLAVQLWEPTAYRRWQDDCAREREAAWRGRERPVTREE